MIKDDKLTCDKCNKELAYLSRNGKKQLHILKDLAINVPPVPRKDLSVTCPYCGFVLPIERSLLGIK